MDYENVHKLYAEGMEILTMEDIVYVFYALKECSQEGNKKIYADIKRTQAQIESKCGRVKLIRTRNKTKNAMDFQIVSLLSLLVGENGSGAKYYILSKDKGYKAAIQFILNNYNSNLSIERIVNFRELRYAEEVKRLLDEEGYSKKVISEVRKGFKKTNNLHDYTCYLEQNIRKDFPDVYKLTKPLYKELHRIVQHNNCE